MGKLARRLTATTGDTLGLSGVTAPRSWLVSLFGGGATASGTKVTADTALRSGVVWACANLLSWLYAYLPLKVMRALDSGGAAVDRKHPNYRILAQQPNGWQTGFQRRQFTGMSLFLRGNSYEVIERDADGTILSLTPIHPDYCQVYVTQAGMPIYCVTLWPSGKVVWFSRFEMHHNWLVSGNGYTGLSPVEICSEGIGYNLASEEYGARVLAGGGMVSGGLEIPPSLTDEQQKNVEDSWRETHGKSVSNVGKVAMLRGGVKFTPIGLSSVDAQWIQSRNLSIEEVCRIMWRVPPAMVGHTAPTSSWGTGEIARYMGFLALVMDPILVSSEQAMQRDLFLPAEFDIVFPQYSRAALLRTDLLTRYRSYAIGRQWGWLTVNKINNWEDEPGIGPAGDVLLDPANMVRIPLDPTAVLDAPGGGTGAAALGDDPRVRAFLQKVLTGAGSAEGADHA